MSSEPKDVGARGRGKLWLVAVAAAAIVAHLPALRNAWTLDDTLLLVGNPYLRSVSGLVTMLHNELFATSAAPRIVPYYRPVTAALYWLSYQLLGTSTVLQHLLNLLMHAGSCVLFVRAAIALGLGRPAAIGAGLVLAVHPATADIVAYIGGRQDLLGWMFVWLAVAGVVRARTWPAIAAWTFGGVLAATLTREFFGAAAVLLVLAAAWRPPASRRHDLTTAAASGSAALLTVVGLRELFDIAPFVNEGVSVADAPGAAAGVALRLLRDVLWPTDLSVDVTIRPYPLPVGVIVAAALLGAAGLLVRLARRRCAHATLAVVLGTAVVALLAAVHAGVALKFGFISDRYAYGAVAGVALAVAPLLSTLRLPSGFKLLADRRFAGALAVTALVGLSMLTWARAVDYRNNESLQLAMMRDRPDDPQTVWARGAWLFHRGQEQEAFPHCLRYRQLMPNATSANLCIAAGMMRQNEMREAADLLWPYALSRPGEVRARVMLFRALFAIGDLKRVEEALAYFEPPFGNHPDIQAARQELERRRERRR